MHTTDQHRRVDAGTLCDGDYEAVTNDICITDCDVCLMFHEDDLEAIREFTPTATRIENIMVQYRQGILMPWEVESKLHEILCYGEKCY